MDDDMASVLRRVAEHFGPPGVHRFDTPFDVPGLDFNDRVAPVLRRLAEANPPFVEGLTVEEADYPVVVTGLTDRGWEAAKAAGDARNGSQGEAASAPLATAVAASGMPFQVALSFAGEQRGYVQRVANALAALRIAYFYDDEQKIALWGRNQGEELQRVYMDDSSTVVMFISYDYAQKNWPIHERRSALTRAIRERREYVLPVRFDDVVLPGLDPDMSYLNAQDFTPEELAAAIAEKLVALGVAVPAASSASAGWARAATGRSSSDMTVTVVDDAGLPVPEAQVLAVARNGTYVAARTDQAGAANLRLPARRLVTVYIANPATAPTLVRDHDPANDLEVTLPRLAGIGSLIFQSGTGSLPGLTGRLNPIRDEVGADGRHYLYADNISINDQPQQPYQFALGQPLTLEDAQGARAVVTIVELIGRSSLVRFEQ
jgi:hypothetical protein